MYGIEKLRETIEKHIQQLEFENPPAELYKPISYTLNSNGKRIRPLLQRIKTIWRCVDRRNPRHLAKESARVYPRNQDAVRRPPGGSGHPRSSRLPQPVRRKR